jgi:lysophospholipase L1-like esterase
VSIRRSASIALALVLVALFASGGAAAATDLPSSMASVGDSITRAYNTCSSAYVDCPPNSWSTGTSVSVNGHYNRLLAVNPAIAGHNFNDAVSGAKMAGLNGQVTTVNARGVQYVTILMGGNDVCTSSESTMTSVADFTGQFQLAMSTLTSGSPNAKIFVASIPDVSNLYAVLKGNGSARFIWALFRICQSMLARPLSTAQSDVDRRARVNQRNIDFNTALATICLKYAPNCKFDSNAVFNFQFKATDVSTRDYFHPSLSGQKRLACATWGAGYWAPAVREIC